MAQSIPRRRRRPPDSLANDLLVGAAAIAEFLGFELSATYYGLAKGYIPATKRGDQYIGSKARLRRHYQADGAR